MSMSGFHLATGEPKPPAPAAEVKPQFNPVLGHAKPEAK